VVGIKEPGQRLVDPLTVLGSLAGFRELFLHLPVFLHRRRALYRRQGSLPGLDGEAHRHQGARHQKKCPHVD